MLAAFLQPVQPLPALHAAALAAVPAPPAATIETLPGFNMQQQQQSNWCWSAVSCSVAEYYHPPGPTQCDVASRELKLPCCGADAPPGCNQYGFLDQALAIVGNFDHIVNSTVSFSDAKLEIDNGRPICCRIAWLLGGAHFLAIAGYQKSADGTDYIAIQDPAFGPKTLPFSAFVDGYRMSGDAWTHTYYTRAVGVALATWVPDPATPSSA